MQRIVFVFRAVIGVVVDTAQFIDFLFEFTDKSTFLHNHFVNCIAVEHSRDRAHQTRFTGFIKRFPFLTKISETKTSAW